jgi:hypothetical protein
MENVTITLELKLEDVNKILASLGKHPFDEIVELIGRIRIQGEEQLKALQEAEAVEVSEEV